MNLRQKSDFLDTRSLPPEELIFGRSAAMAAVREKLDRVANTTIPVLVQGESGTGKDILAQRLHGLSARSAQPWVKVTCPAIPVSLIESELFGYEKGAFTGAYATKRGRVELAHKGTLFLDEVGSLDLGSQAKLLQVLQDGSFSRVGGQESRRVDLRLICAANRDLRQQTEDGSFRLDFLFRINAVIIEAPPLRQRIGDLPMLIDHFLEVYGRAFRVTPKPFTREFVRMMQGYDWPGNIRQLENIVRSYVLIGNEEALIADLEPAPPTQQVVPKIDLDNPISLKQITKNATRELERQIIHQVLRANRGNRLKTAKWLNISYRSLLYKLEAPRGEARRTARREIRPLQRSHSLRAPEESMPSGSA